MTAMTSILALTSIAAMTADLFQLGPQKAIILLAERRHSSCPSYCMTSAAGLAHVGCYAIRKLVEFVGMAWPTPKAQTPSKISSQGI